MNATSQTETSFVLALQTHRSSDFSLLYNAYAPALYGVLLRLVNDPARAEDLLQDAFVKIWSNSHQYDPKQGRLFTWLLTITRNIAMDELRARKVQVKAASYLYEQSEQTTVANVPEGPVHGSLLNHLAPKYRAVVELMYYRDYTSQEAADQLKIPVGTVKTRIRTALQQLKVHFNQDIHHYLSWYRA
ncbi:sigma-70 family RNA polymerase sigma factor [Spirosoma sp. KCTC 42546]|uniref:RNA polymerase sigma factor n=1 Tax=Spirosoma sp. KCTC 42546 TaxID=2520506 RepID=UPI0011594959|nr:sigma-70 family RNA polymerase sigma factor [Spirosoma sp. KCTC 42546]QDK81080.1 sigma-70 family RNA polymerase sigma factor [Spirosoma sp. KCTC 42546]